MSVSEDEEVLGLPRLAFPPGVKRKFLVFISALCMRVDTFRLIPFFLCPVRTRGDAEAEPSKMVGGLTSAEFARLLSRQLDGQANQVYFGELPGQSIPAKAGDDDVGTSRKRKRAVAKGGQVRSRRATKYTAESGGEEEEDDRDAGSEDDGSHGYSPS